MSLAKLVGLALICGAIMASSNQRDAFSTLGVKRSASDKEIKAAYRKLSLQYHPDKSPNTQDKFIEISEAYEQIGDEKSRRNYLQNLAMEGQRMGGVHSFSRRGAGSRSRHAHADDIFAAFEQQFAREFSRSRMHRGRGGEFWHRNGGPGGHFYSFSYSGFSNNGEAENFPSTFRMIWSIGSLLLVPFLTTMGPVIMVIIYCCCQPSGREEDSTVGGQPPSHSKSADRGDALPEDSVNASQVSEQLPELRELDVPKGMIVVASLDRYSMELLLLVAPHFKYDPHLMFRRCESGASPTERESEEGDDDICAKERGPRFRGISVCSRGHAFYTGSAHESDEEAMAKVVMWVEKLVSGEVTWRSNDELALVDSDGGED